MMATAEDTVLTLQPVKYKLAGASRSTSMASLAWTHTVKQTIKAPCIIEPSSTAASTPR